MNDTSLGEGNAELIRALKEGCPLIFVLKYLLFANYHLFGHEKSRDNGLHQPKIEFQEV